MKRLVLLAALVSAIPSVALAAASAQDGQSFRGVTQIDLVGGMVRSDSSAKAFTMSSTGGVAVYDEDRDRDKNDLMDLFSGTNMTVLADSNVVPKDVRAYRYLKLLVKLTPRTATATVRVAFQFREITSPTIVDSTTTFAEYQYAASNQGGALSLVDSLTTGHLATGSATAPWSGEYIVTAAVNRNAGGTTNTFQHPGGIAIPLDSMFGRPARFRYLQVRMRNLTQSNGVDYTVQLLGFAQ